ncbi:MAG: ComEC/Rec2 family competence protein [Holosporales bacterium]|jgi:ComEC/Rec2-related protein|nr:ComEC/Rec2 family competence protein [Holosporales bacterium]
MPTARSALPDIFEQDRWFLWIPVFMAIGSVAYFSWSNEPSYAVPIIAALLGGGGRYLLKRWLLSCYVVGRDVCVGAAPDPSAKSIPSVDVNSSVGTNSSAGIIPNAKSKKISYAAHMWCLLLTNLLIAFAIGFAAGKLRTSMQHTANFFCIERLAQMFVPRDASSHLTVNGQIATHSTPETGNGRIATPSMPETGNGRIATPSSPKSDELAYESANERGRGSAEKVAVERTDESPQTICGIVDSVEDVPRGTLARPRQLRRCVLSHILGMPAFVKVRVQGAYNKLQYIQPFAAVLLRCDIFPPPPQLAEHGYDAQFDAYFKGLSAFGKVREVLAIRDLSEYPALAQQSNPGAAIAAGPALSRVYQVRTRLSNELRARLPASVSSLATALVTGDKSGISMKVREDFTRSGLSHMLAISGLHMGLLAWLFFTVFTRLLVLVPRLATRFVVKKIAAIVTIPFTFGYLLLSGASFSALRAFITVTLSMLAILCNQRAISLRNTAIAACLILIIFPESVYSVSFQLSFASVTGLCFLADWMHEREKREPDPFAITPSFFARSKFGQLLLRHFIRPIGQGAATTLIATIATTPIIIYVFQRITLVSVVGNLVAVPFLSVFVMPLLALSLLISTDFMFMLAGKSLSILLRIAEVVASLPGSNYVLPRPDLISVLLITFSSLWFIIWHGQKRLISLPLFVIGWLWLLTPTHPDVFLMRDLIGVCKDDVFYISSQRFGSFHAKVWSQECGIQVVEPMPYRDIEKWQSELDALIPDSADDVVFLTKRINGGWNKRTLNLGQTRPWVVGLDTKTQSTQS